MRSVHPVAPHILVVEDDQGIGEMLQLMLELEGYRVTWTRNVPDTIAFLAANAARHANERALSNGRQHPGGFPQLILLDLQLKDLDAQPMIRQLNRHGCPLPPIIIVSARQETQALAAARSIGAADVLLKPFEVPELLDRIQRVLADAPISSSDVDR